MRAGCDDGNKKFTFYAEWMPDTTYVFELKTNDTAENALRQIDSKAYALPYQAQGRQVVKVGVRFNAETRIPEDWRWSA